jgi:hypothetical protein
MQLEKLAGCDKVFKEKRSAAAASINFRIGTGLLPRTPECSFGAPGARSLRSNLREQRCNAALDGEEKGLLITCTGMGVS